MGFPERLKSNLVQVRLLVEHLAGGLRAVVHSDLLWQSSLSSDSIQDLHALAREPPVQLDHRALTAEVIHQRQEPELPIIEQLIGHEG